MLRTKRVSFLWGMVTAEMRTFRTWDLDAASVELSDNVTAALKDSNPGISGLAFSLAEVVTFTVAMAFDWKEDTPPEIRGLETFWGMIEKAQTNEAFAFFSRELDNIVLFGSKQYNCDGWSDAMLTALKRWTPEEQKMPSDDADPLPVSDTSSGSAQSSSLSGVTAAATGASTESAKTTA